MAFSSWLCNWKRSLERRWVLRQALPRKPAHRWPRLEARRSESRCSPQEVSRGYAWLYRHAIQQAHLGADFDFLRHEALRP